MSNESSLSGFKVGKLYTCRNPLPEDYDEYYWVLFAGINNWDEHTNILYANHTFMVLEIFSYIGSDFEDEDEDERCLHWIKVLTDTGVVGWFKYDSVYYTEEDFVEELKLC